MITEKQYIEALNTVDKYRKQLSLSIVSGSFKIDVYEYLKAEIMATTHITLDEFKEVIEIWVHRTIKKTEKQKLMENYH